MTSPIKSMSVISFDNSLPSWFPSFNCTVNNLYCNSFKQSITEELHITLCESAEETKEKETARREEGVSVVMLLRERLLCHSLFRVCLQGLILIFPTMRDYPYTTSKNAS